MNFPFFIKSIIFNTVGNGCTKTRASAPVTSTSENETKVQLTIMPKESFSHNDQKLAVLGQCDIPEFKLMSRLNDGWKQLSENESLWQKIGIALQSTDLLNKDQVKKYYQTTHKQAHNCFDNETLSHAFRNELNRLYQSERIADINLLREVCEARDTLVVWEMLQHGGNTRLDFSGFDSIEALLNTAVEFHDWCVQNQNQLAVLDRLDLRGANLTSLPAELGYLNALELLYLNDNQLTSLPPEIGNLTALRALHLSDNCLKSLPPEIGNLSVLESFYLHCNQLTSLPVEIGKLTKLESLYLGKNQLTKLPAEIGNLAALQRLDLWENPLNVFPDEIVNLPALKTLNLNLNCLSSLPAEIGNLAGLQSLYLDYNQLTSLPAEIRNLVALERLGLSGNQLTALPPEIGNLVALRGLTLENNSITALPREFKDLPLLDFKCDMSLKLIYTIQKIQWAITDCCGHAIEGVIEDI